MQVRLHHVAHVRSGDKGNTSNVSVIAYSEQLYPFLKDQLTADRFRAFYVGVVRGHVERYSIDELWVLNFVAHEALGGGVSRNLNFDNYGKALSSAILGFELEIPERLKNHLRGL